MTIQFRSFANGDRLFYYRPTALCELPGLPEPLRTAFVRVLGPGRNSYSPRIEDWRVLRALVGSSVADRPSADDYRLASAFLNPDVASSYSPLEERCPAPSVRRKMPEHLRTQFQDEMREYARAMRRGRYESDMVDAADELATTADLLAAHGFHSEVQRAINNIVDRHGAGGEPWAIVRADCGHYAPLDRIQSNRSGHTRFCQSCADEDFVTMRDGSLEHRDDDYYWESDDEYHYDPEPDDDDDDDDDDDANGLLTNWGASTATLAHDRSFVPSPLGDFTMGVELEVQASEYGERTSKIKQCEAFFNEERQYAMFKEDGSLDDGLGFEIVTAARRLPDHITMFSGWSPRGLNAWDNGNCGMHVHLDSRAFTALTLGKFLMFYNHPHNASFIRRIAGRHPEFDEQARTYARAIHQDLLDLPSKALKGENANRYYMVNLTNLTYNEAQRLSVSNHDRDCKGSYSTIELRVFRASLSKRRLLAQLEFAHASVLFSRTASWQKLSGDEFLKWLAASPGMYPNLARWFGLITVREHHSATTQIAQPAEI